MKAQLDALDARLRQALTATAPGMARAGLAVLTALAFFLLMMTRPLAQLAGASAAARAAGVLVLTLPLALMLALAMRVERENEGSLLSALLLCALCAAAMLARVSFIDRSSGDYDIYLASWLEKLAAGSFAQGMRADVGEYNVLYQYILFLITRMPAPALYAVKAVSFAGDALLALGAARLAGREGRANAAAFGAVLLLPTVVLNGGMFAQCDSLYAACAVWGLALALEGKPARSAVCFALSLAFKLQAVFLLPIVAVLWADKKLRLSDALVFLGTLLAVMLPALLGGKSLARIVGIYAGQTGLYTGLTYNAPSLFGLLETEGLDVYAYGSFGMGLAFGAAALLTAAGIRRAGRLSGDGYAHLAVLMTLVIVFLLPRMHERYFYLALVLSVVLACRLPALLPAAVLTELASLSACWALHIPLYAASIMMMTAGMLVGISFMLAGKGVSKTRKP